MNVVIAQLVGLTMERRAAKVCYVGHCVDFCILFGWAVRYDAFMVVKYTHAQLYAQT